VIRALETAGIRPDLVCGTSSARWWAQPMSRASSRRSSNGCSAWASATYSRCSTCAWRRHDQGRAPDEFLNQHFIDRPIEALPMPFGAVATALDSGTEVWLREGSTIAAVRASIALPALFRPVAREGRLLVDGALVNPVPVSLARAMGADIVIAVDLSSDVLGAGCARSSTPSARHRAERMAAQAAGAHQHHHARTRRGRAQAALDPRSRRHQLEHHAGARHAQPHGGRSADAIVAPRLAHLGLLDFHRAREAIEAGELAVEAALPA